MKLWITLVTVLILVMNSKLGLADDFQSDFFNSQSQWEDIKSKKDSIKSKDSQPQPVVPEKPKQEQQNNSPSQPATNIQKVSQETKKQDSVNTPVATPPSPPVATDNKSSNAQANDKQPPSKNLPVKLEDIAEDSGDGQALADTPGVAIDKLIQISPSIDEFSKTPQALGLHMIAPSCHSYP